MLGAEQTSLTLNFPQQQNRKIILCDKHILKYEWHNLCRSLGTYVAVTDINLVRWRIINVNDRKNDGENSTGLKICKRGGGLKERAMLAYAEGKHGPYL